ncbi:MAG: thioredoxin-disulfide reductase [Anaerolineae bacterium]|nr:thioredoxin-disulfide reductase [Anaerolineae bacterium]
MPGKAKAEQDMIIIGGGPAGLTAGLYGARADLAPLVLIGEVVGGQAATTTDIENYPGFPEGVGGAALAQQMQTQAERFGANVQFDMVKSINLQTYPFEIQTNLQSYTAKTIVITTGSSPRTLGVPGEDKFRNNGVSYCATCDGYFFKDQRVVVVGGGNSAIDESLFLSRLVDEITIVHRRDELRADPILQERAFANPKIKFLWNTVVLEILGEKKTRAVQVQNVKTGERGEIETNGVFIYVGHTPNTQLFQGQLDLDEAGYILTDKRQRTSVEGVFAAGDVQDPVFRQIATAVGTGAAAAIEAVRFLDKKEYESKR